MILVTGGTGRLGHQLVHVLRSVGQDTRCLVRKGSEYYWLNDTGCSYFFGDLRDPKSLSRALRDVDYVVAAAGVRVERTDNHHGNVTKDGNISLFDAAVQRGVKHVVFVSCHGVETGPEAPAFANKKAAEDHLIASGLSYTILRPGLLAGSFADLVRKQEYNGSTFLPGRAETRVSPLAERDLSLMCLASLDLEAVRNKIVHVGGPDVLTVGEAFRIACEAAGVKPNTWPLKPTALKVLSKVVTPFGRRWNHHLRALEVMFGKDNAADPEEMRRLFDLPLMSYADAIAASLGHRYPGEDPTAREEKVVHRQFTATIYEPGVVPLASLPDGPAPRQD